MGDNQILFCPMLENYFHVFQRNVKVDFQQFNVNLFKEWRFPLMKIASLRLRKDNMLVVYCSFQFELTVVFIATFSSVETEFKATKQLTWNLFGISFTLS